ncbi:MAG: hypothetical protein PHY28_01365 [Dehalococcoidales bacterium]|nr:hypothetical protein [Dehalococcoidales bacterium]
MKTPIWIISLALTCYYEGMTLSAIQTQINQQHGAYYAQSSIYNWIVRFSKEAVEKAKSLQIKTGSTWFLFYTLRKKGNQQTWFMDIFDTESKFLLASHLTDTITRWEIISLIEKGRILAGKTPNQKVTILLSPNINAMETIGKIRNSETIGNNIFKRNEDEDEKQYRELLKKRGNVIRGFKNMDTTQILTSTWLIHYNFLTVKSAGRTPLQKTGKALFKSWIDIVSRAQSANNFTGRS